MAGTVIWVILFILTASIVMFSVARMHFNKIGKNSIEGLLQQPGSNENINLEKIRRLPEPVQKYLLRSGIAGKKDIQFVRLKQVGEMRTSNNGRWMPFCASQYFETSHPQFVWQTFVKPMPLLTITGRDIFKEGMGNMQIQLLSLITLAKAGPDEKTNSATMIRFLAEASWFPCYYLNDCIQWNSIDSNTAKVTMNYKGYEVSAIMRFDENGDLKLFEAQRYRNNKTTTLPETWQVEMLAYKEFQGWRIPYKSKVVWKLNTGDFHWANVEITELEFNCRERYE